MKLALKFDHIQEYNGVPCLRVIVNNDRIYDGPVLPIMHLEHVTTAGPVEISIQHHGKDPSQHMLMEQGRIVRDRACELTAITVDGYDLEELKWQSRYIQDDGMCLEKCLFFGTNGQWQMQFALPILPWILGTRHAINGNDPYWQTDYESYMKACKLLNNKN